MPLMNFSWLRRICSPLVVSSMQSIARDGHLSGLMAALRACGKMLENLYQALKLWIAIYKVWLLYAPAPFCIFSCISGMLSSLITRHPNNRPTPATLPSHPFFSSLPISTLNFLDRSNFTSKTREEKISFMKGLVNVLDKFSEGLRTRKILPTLLEEVVYSPLRVQELIIESHRWKTTAYFHTSYPMCLLSQWRSPQTSLQTLFYQVSNHCSASKIHHRICLLYWIIFQCCRARQIRWYSKIVSSILWFQWPTYNLQPWSRCITPGI